MKSKFCVYALVFVSVTQINAIGGAYFRRRESESEVRGRQQRDALIQSRMNAMAPMISEVWRVAELPESKEEPGTHFYEEGDWHLYENNNDDEKILEFMAYQVPAKLQQERADRRKFLWGIFSAVVGVMGYTVARTSVQQEQKEIAFLAFMGGSITSLCLYFEHDLSKYLFDVDARTVQLLCKNYKSDVVKRMIEVLDNECLRDSTPQEKRNLHQQRRHFMQKALEKQAGAQTV